MEQRKRDAYEVLNVRPDAHAVVIRAAYRALAALYHPDSNPDAGATRRMAELNEAYAQVETPDRRRVYDRSRQQLPAPQPTGAPGRQNAMRAAPSDRPDGRQRPTATPGSSVIDFGRYQGWTIADLARHDPDYLKWLSRHSSGIRYRREIAERLTKTEKDEGRQATQPRRR